RKDNSHVGETFVARGLGFAIAQDAVGEVDQLGSKLIALVEASRALPAFGLEPVRQWLRELICGVDRDAAIGADDLVYRTPWSAEAGGECADAVLREVHHC